MTPRLPARLLHLAGAGLAHASPVERDGWEDQLDVVVHHGLAGILAHLYEEGQVDLDRPAVDRLERRLHAEAVLAVRLEAELIRMAPVLDHLGAVVLKGPVLAHGAYPSPRWRPFTDLDLLVAGHRLREATAELERLGYERPRPDPSPAFQRHVAKATAFVHPSGLMVDLHRTLASGGSGEGVDVGAIIGGRRLLQVGAVPIPRPSWDAHLIEVSLHAVVGDALAKAMSIRDVAQVAGHAEVRPEQVIGMATDWRVERVVAAALLAARDGLGGVLPPRLDAWVGTVDASAGESSGDRRRLPLRAGELRRGGPRHRLAVLRALVAPRPAFLRWRYGEAALPMLYWRRWHDLSRRSIDPWRSESAAAHDRHHS